MVEFKLVVNDSKTGKSYQKTIDGSKLLGKKIGEKVKGDTVGISGYEFEVTGGSDFAGFPMRKSLDGSGRKKALLSKGPGVKIKGKGVRKRKTICGNTIGSTIKQVNLKVLSYGRKSLEELIGKKEMKEEEEVKEEEKEVKIKKETKEAKEEKSSGGKSTA